MSKKSVPGDRGQTRQQYALTAEGRRVFFERMNAFSETDASSPEAFHLRVGVFAGLKRSSRAAILAARKNYLTRRDEKLKALQAHVDLGKFGGEIVRYMRKQIEMEREWIRHLRRI